MSHPGGYIQHTVSKFDTLVGVAIKYGVEVADIRRMNGLVTDHQMFALPYLHIPMLPHHERRSQSTSSDKADNSNQRLCRTEEGFRHHRKSKSLAKLDDYVQLSDSMPSNSSDQSGKRIRRRQESEAHVQTGRVRKSASATNMQDHEFASIWSIKSDLQVLPTAGITKPIYDGLPKPMIGRRNKAALD